MTSTTSGPQEVRTPERPTSAPMRGRERKEFLGEASRTGSSGGLRVMKQKEHLQLDLQKILSHLPQDHHPVFQKILSLRQERGATNAPDMVDDEVVREVMQDVRNPASLSRAIFLSTHPDKSQK